MKEKTFYNVPKREKTYKETMKDIRKITGIKEEKTLNENIGLARQSGYNEACYLCNKKHKQFIKEVLAEIVNKQDHYEPYRPITDSPEAKKVRKVLAELYEFIKQKAGGLANE